MTCGDRSQEQFTVMNPGCPWTPTIIWAPDDILGINQLFASMHMLYQGAPTGGTTYSAKLSVIPRYAAKVKTLPRYAGVVKVGPNELR